MHSPCVSHSLFSGFFSFSSIVSLFYYLLFLSLFLLGNESTGRKGKEEKKRNSPPFDRRSGSGPICTTTSFGPHHSHTWEKIIPISLATSRVFLRYYLPTYLPTYSLMLFLSLHYPSIHPSPLPFHYVHYIHCNTKKPPNKPLPTYLTYQTGFSAQREDREEKE
ncbi:hypothetical protein F4775DRAFT_163276 [Biscogniauxia sp. FL1348]|nr:hypothetical protein F4775DRAFT_163276 [Biscogniauxia sp. FL1348]